LQPGGRFGNYTLELRLGGGGFGSVWRAKDTTSGETVALKILVGKFSSGDVGRIRSEVELLAAAASADSPHVVRVLGGGTEPSPHVVMEFIEGHDLEQELDQRTKLPQDETLRIVRAVAEALGVLERAGIIHRDVKPANVMLADDGTIKLTDFGIAKIAGYESVTATGQLPLSAAYAAPEVWGGEATYQSDFYALGAVAFQCLTGSRPFAGTFVQLYEFHKTRPPDWALLPGETVPALRQLMVSCLAKEPAERPANSAALLSLVGEAEAELAQHTPDGGKTVAGHEPRALGPWLIESKHESQPWAFRCLHETSGERATVEVHFSDSLDLGEQIKLAVTANPTLVPLGAERLLGTNRLILRPGESWPDRPPGQFMFWVARQELPAPRAPSTLTDQLVVAGAAAALRLKAAASTVGVMLTFAPGNAFLSGDGSIYVSRPGLPGQPAGESVVEWLRQAAPGSDLLRDVESDPELAELIAGRNLLGSVPAAGVAVVAPQTASLTDRSEASALLDWSEIRRAPPPPDAIRTNPLSAPSPPAGAAADGSSDRSRQRSAALDRAEVHLHRAQRKALVGILLGAVLLVALVAAGAISSWSGSRDAALNESGPKTGSAQNGSSSATPTLPETPSTSSARYVVRSGDTCGAIAANNNVTLLQLSAANGWTDLDRQCQQLTVGQEIVVPSATPTATPAPPTATQELPTPTEVPGPALASEIAVSLQGLTKLSENLYRASFSYRLNGDNDGHWAISINRLLYCSDAKGTALGLGNSYGGAPTGYRNNVNLEGTAGTAYIDFSADLLGDSSLKTPIRCTGIEGSVSDLSGTQSGFGRYSSTCRWSAPSSWTGTLGYLVSVSPPPKFEYYGCVVTTR
jgi:serine/threonine protein kinase/LysM repeat protein